MTTTNDEESKKKNKIWDIVLLISIILFVIISIFIIIDSSKKAKEKEAYDYIDDVRFDVIVSQKEPTDSDIKQFIVVADRNTDVEYLVVIGKNGVGVTTMRDKGGTVLLRE